MAITELPDGYISDPFDITENGMTYSDAVVMSKAEYDALTPEQLAAIKQQRFDNWYAIVTAGDVAAEETTADEQAV